MEPSEPSSVDMSRGAVCSAHPTVAASSTCVRCGDFLCEECRVSGESICAACRARTVGPAFPVDRERFEIGAAVSYAWQCFQREWLALTGAGSAAVVLPIIVMYAIMIPAAFLAGSTSAASGQDAAAAGGAAMMGIMFVSYVVTIALQFALYLGGFSLAIDVLEGRPASFAGWFRGMKRLPAAFGQFIVLYLGIALVIAPIVGIAIGVGSVAGEDVGFLTGGILGLASFVPLVWLGLGLGFIWSELAYDPAAGPIESIRRSLAIAKGHRLDVFLLYLVVMGVSIAGYMACCVGYLPAMGLVFLVHGATYLGLRRGLLAPVER